MKATIDIHEHQYRFRLYTMDVLVLTIESANEPELLAALDAINDSINEAVSAMGFKYG